MLGAMPTNCLQMEFGAADFFLLQSRLFSTAGQQQQQQQQAELSQEGAMPDTDASLRTFVQWQEACEGSILNCIFQGSVCRWPEAMHPDQMHSANGRT